MNIFHWASNLKINGKIWLLVSTVAAGLAVVVLVTQNLAYSHMHRDRITSLRWIVETAHGVAGELEKRVKAGEFTQEQAVKELEKVMTGMRYGNNEYLFAFTYDSVAVINIGSPQLVGQSFDQVEDASGDFIIREMSRIAREEGEGTVSYHWVRSGTEDNILKTSYVKAFRPWGIYLGTGVYMDDLEAEFAAFRRETLLWVALVLLAAGGMAVAIGRTISGPVTRLSKATSSLASGDLDTDVPECGRGDEIGQLANAVQVFKELAIESEKMRSEAQKHLEDSNRMNEEQLRLQQEADETRKELMEKEKDAAEQRRREVYDLANSFEQEIGGIVQLLQGVVEEVGATSTDLTTNTQTSRTECEMAAGSAEEASSNAQTVASAAEELIASIGEISHQLSSSREASAEAVELINTTDVAVSSLADQAEQISRITNLITDIAEQTNLLALNATIEAARAGESGRGFAVVASEVKALATQTGKAATEIGDQIVSVQEQTEATVERIRNVKDMVHSNDSVTSSIAVAVEEQGTATQEIVRNIQEAASGTADVSLRIATVRKLAGEAADNAQVAGEVSSRLRDACASLDKAAGNFVGVMRTG